MSNGLLMMHYVVSEEDLIESVPLIMIDVRAAKINGDAEAIEYAKLLVPWMRKAKAFTARHKKETNK